MVADLQHDLPVVACSIVSVRRAEDGSTLRPAAGRQGITATLVREQTKLVRRAGALTGAVGQEGLAAVV